MKPERMWDQWKFVSITNDAKLFPDGVPGELVAEQRRTAVALLLKELDIPDEDTLKYEVSREPLNPGEDALDVWRQTYTMKGWKK